MRFLWTGSFTAFTRIFQSSINGLVQHRINRFRVNGLGKAAGKSHQFVRNIDRILNDNNKHLQLLSKFLSFAKARSPKCRFGIKHPYRRMLILSDAFPHKRNSADLTVGPCCRKCKKGACRTISEHNTLPDTLNSKALTPRPKPIATSERHCLLDRSSGCCCLSGHKPPLLGL